MVQNLFIVVMYFVIILFTNINRYRSSGYIVILVAVKHPVARCYILFKVAIHRVLYCLHLGIVVEEAINFLTEYN